MARPRKYRTPEALRLARRIQTRESKRRKRILLGRHRQFAGMMVNDVADPRPPIEVVMERDFRYGLLGNPPAEYAAHYAQTAQRQQQIFATGS